MADIRTYLLDPADWGRLAAIFTENGSELPHPDVAQIAVAERDGEIIGFAVLQLVAHLEPLYLTEAARHVWPRLVKTAMDAYSGPVYAFAPNDQIASMAQHAGFTQLPWSVMRID
jgi:hypothetical protein